MYKIGFTCKLALAAPGDIGPRDRPGDAEDLTGRHGSGLVQCRRGRSRGAAQGGRASNRGGGEGSSKGEATARRGGIEGGGRAREENGVIEGVESNTRTADVANVCSIPRENIRRSINAPSNDIARSNRRRPCVYHTHGHMYVPLYLRISALARPVAVQNKSASTHAPCGDVVCHTEMTAGPSRGRSRLKHCEGRRSHGLGARPPTCLCRRTGARTTRAPPPSHGRPIGRAEASSITCYVTGSASAS